MLVALIVTSWSSYATCAPNAKLVTLFVLPSRVPIGQVRANRAQLACFAGWQECWDPLSVHSFPLSTTGKCITSFLSSVPIPKFRWQWLFQKNIWSFIPFGLPGMYTFLVVLSCFRKSCSCFDEIWERTQGPATHKAYKLYTCVAAPVVRYQISSWQLYHFLKQERTTRNVYIGFL